MSKRPSIQPIMVRPDTPYMLPRKGSLMDKEKADNLRLQMDEQDSMSAASSPEPTIWRVRVGIEIPYGTFVPTRCKPSKAHPDKGIRGMVGGDGLYSTTRITPFSWLGLYPGRVCNHLGSTRSDSQVLANDCAVQVDFLGNGLLDRSETF